MNYLKFIHPLGILVLFLVNSSLAQTENWVYRYNGPGNGWDAAFSVVYGSDGNVYAAGYSTGNGTLYDFTIISLNTQGDTNWVYTYNGSANSFDQASSITFGADGNIYAAGVSVDTISYRDFTVISLDTSGSERWVYKYDRIGIFHPGDEASSIIYGEDGNVYAAGYSTSEDFRLDFTVISLDTSGVENWVYIYNNNLDDVAYDIAYGNGNIYAAGLSPDSFTSGDIVIISVDTSGTENWVYRYDGSAYGADNAYSIVFGADGNIYAAGVSSDTLTSYDFTVISVDTTGTENWVYRYNGPSGDYALSVTFGSDGNTYAAGYTNNGTANDFTVISLDTSGVENWVYRYDGPGGVDDAARSIIFGADGNIYAAGGVSGNFTVVSLDTSGAENWVYSYNGPGDEFGKAYSINFGTDGNVYAAGQGYDPTTYFDFTTISLNPSVGIEENSSLPKVSTITTIPSFFQNKITINFGYSSPLPLTVKFYDILGNRCFEEKLDSTPISYTFDSPVLRQLSSGVYFVLVHTSQMTFSPLKVIKLP